MLAPPRAPWLVKTGVSSRVGVDGAVLQTVPGRVTIALIALSLVCSPAGADTYEAVLRRASLSRDRAVETNRLADWQETFELFTEAIATRETSEAEFELATAARHLNLQDEAFEGYERALELGMEGRAREEATTFLNEQRDQMGHLSVRGPAEGSLFVRARRRGRLPLARPLVALAGRAPVRLEIGGRQLEKDVTIAAGATTEVSFDEAAGSDVVPAPAPSPGAAQGGPRAAPGPAPAGPAPPTDRGSSSSGWGLPVTVAGGVTTTVGVLTYLFAAGELQFRRESLDKTCAVRAGDECQDTAQNLWQSALEDERAISTWKVVRATGGGIALAGGVVTGIGIWKLLQPDSPPARKTVAVSVGPESVLVRGTF